MKTTLGLGLPQGVKSPVTENIIASWSSVGNIFDSDTYAAVDFLDGNDIALGNFASDELLALRWDGSDLVQQGNALSLNMGSADSIIRLTSNSIVWIDHARDDLYAYEWDGTDWSQLGNVFDFGDTSGYASGCYLQDNEFAMWSGNGVSSPHVQKLVFDGTDFTKVGNTLSATGIFQMPIAMDTDRIAILDSFNDEVRAYDFDGTDWTQVGNTYSLPTVVAGAVSGTKLVENKILVWVGTSIQALKFDGTDFVPEGSSYNFGASNSPCSMAALSEGLIAIHFYGSGGNIRVVEASFA